MPFDALVITILAFWQGADHDAPAASRPAPPAPYFAKASFEDLTPVAPDEADVDIWSKARRRLLTLEWPGRVWLAEKPSRSPRDAVANRLTATAITASHALEGEGEDPYDLDEGAAFELAGDVFGTGIVTSVALRDGEALFDARAVNGNVPSLRVFGVAKRTEAPSPKKKPVEPSTSMIRRGSVYPEGEHGQHLDAYYVRDASVASESLPSVDNFSIAGAGDRPRRFMRGHRFTHGEGTVIALRFCDAVGGSLRLSFAIPAKRSGVMEIPNKDVAVAITELSPDPAVGRILESIAGTIRFQPVADSGARLELAIDARLRRVGARDPERLLVFGEYWCVPLPIEELTPWLGRYIAGKPSLETFAVPGSYDR